MLQKHFFLNYFSYSHKSCNLEQQQKEEEMFAEECIEEVSIEKSKIKNLKKL